MKKSRGRIRSIFAREKVIGNITIIIIQFCTSNRRNAFGGISFEFLCFNRLKDIENKDILSEFFWNIPLVHKR